MFLNVALQVYKRCGSWDSAGHDFSSYLKPQSSDRKGLSRVYVAGCCTVQWTPLVVFLILDLVIIFLDFH
jgi:hypothetical protein